MADRSWDDDGRAGVAGADGLDDRALKAALEEAAQTLRALPSARRRPRLSAWPDVVTDSVSLLAPSEKTQNRPAPPSPRAIDRMDRVLGWLMVCSLEERRILWARACRVPWRRLEAAHGRSHTTLRAVAAAGLGRIRRSLTGKSATGTGAARLVARK